MYNIEDYEEERKDEDEIKEKVSSRFKKKFIEQEIYVVNLNKTRLIAVLVAAVFILSTSFLGGVAIGAKINADSSKAQDEQELYEQAVLNEGISNSKKSFVFTDDSSSAQEEESSVKPTESINSSSTKKGKAPAEYSTDSILKELEQGKKIAEKRLEEDLNAIKNPRRGRSSGENIISPSKPKSLSPVSGGRTASMTSASDKRKKVFFIQVAVSSSLERTKNEKNYLRKKKFFKTFFIEDELNGKKVYKLKIGRYNNRDEAEVALAEIHKIKRFEDSYIYTDYVER